jgi:integrase
VAELTERAREYARGSRASSTWRVYEQRWLRFQAWCAEHGEASLPADPRTVCRFLAALAPEWRPATPEDPTSVIVAGHVLVRPGVRPDTVAAYLAAISVAHQGNEDPSEEPDGGTATSGHDVATTSLATSASAAVVANPTRHPMVRRVLAGIRRHPTVAPNRRRDALRPAHLETILATLDPETRLADARDAAIFLVGWKAALRTDDLHRLDITDLQITDEGLTVHLRRSKTDQAGTGVARGITAGDPADPLDAVAAWLRWRNCLAAHGLHTGPAWRGIDRYGRRPRATRMTTQALGRIITTRAAAAGLEGDIGGHSLRRGFATSALAGGAPERAVQHHGRWKSPASMAPYVDEADRYADTNPTRYLH